MTLGKRIKSLLELLDLSQSKLAEITGYTRGSLSFYISDKQIPNANFFIKLIEEFNININWLLTGTGKIFIEHSNEDIDNLEIVAEELAIYIKENLKKEIEELLNEEIVAALGYGLTGRDYETEQKIIEEYLSNHSLQKEVESILNKTETYIFNKLILNKLIDNIIFIFGKMGIDRNILKWNSDTIALINKKELLNKFKKNDSNIIRFLPDDILKSKNFLIQEPELLLFYTYIIPKCLISLVDKLKKYMENTSGIEIKINMYKDFLGAVQSKELFSFHLKELLDKELSVKDKKNNTLNDYAIEKLYLYIKNYKH